MFARQVTREDNPQIVKLILKIYSHSRYGQGCGPLSSAAVAQTINQTHDMFHIYPCFVLDRGDGAVVGCFYFNIFPNYFTAEKSAEEKVFFIDELYRSYHNAKKLLAAAEQYCIEQDVKALEIGNGASLSPRIGKLFNKLGYDTANIVYKKRLSHG